MKIKTLHAHFTISMGSYASSERIGFSVEVDDNDSIEEIVTGLRDRAKKIVGKTAQELYQQKGELESACFNLGNRLNKLRKEWDATAEFLKAQGLNPEAPSMPQFRNLLTAVTVESEVVTEDYDDDDDENDDDDY